MKVIKRDGRAVDYDRNKISIAIEKANNEVKSKERVSKAEIKEIIKYIEELDKKRMLVEDIQDIIEQQLMDMKKFELAKKYMIYRYNRALIRKSNTTDESILGLIKNQNKDFLEEDSDKNSIYASAQRDYIAGEVSKDLTKRILLPEKITAAHEEGILHFHNMNFFLQKIFNCSITNIEDMLDNGTVINDILIESPKSFKVACVVLSQILTNTASNQYGEQSIDISCLGKYIKKSHKKIKKELEEEFKDTLSKDKINKLCEQKLKKEISDGIQSLYYQINTAITTKGEPPVVTLFLNLKKNDSCIKENAMIIEEILNQKLQGIKNKNNGYFSLKLPKLIYVLDEHNCLNGGKYDYLTKLALKCSLKCLSPKFISAKKMCENYEGNVFSPMDSRSFLSTWRDENGNYKFDGRFNQGVVTINLPQIGIISDGNEQEFWRLLDERLELCFEALMCRHYALLGTLSNTSPIHWKYGAISRIDSSEKVDLLLKNGYSTLSLGYLGIYELTMLIKNVSITEPTGHDFAIKVVKYLKKTIEKWKKETGLGFVLYGTPAKNLGYKFAKIDKENFGSIENITDKGYYTDSYHVDDRENIDLYKKLKLESDFQQFSNGGNICYVKIDDIKNNQNELENLIKFIYDNVQYVEFI